MSISAQKLNENRRKVDDRILHMELHVADEKRIMQQALFEKEAMRKIENRIRGEQFGQLKSQVDKSLYDRKSLLASLYNREMEMWKLDVLNKVETVEDRKRRIKDKAFALKEARESASREYISKCLDLQWRDSCDDARTLDSRAMTRFMARERLRQIEERKQNNSNKNEDEERLLAQMQKENDKNAAKENNKIKMQNDAARATQEGIYKQMEENRKQREERFNRQRAEDDAEINAIRKSIQDDIDEQNDRKLQEYVRGKEVMKYNDQFKGIRAQEKAMDDEENAILLDYALRKEREQIQKEENKKMAAKNAALKFKKYLEEQMQREAEDNQWVDAIRKAEEEKVWKARDDQLKAREDARNYLMQQVDNGRKEQIKYKEERERLEKEGEIVYVHKFLKDAKEGVEMEQKAREERRVANIANNEKLREQIALREAIIEKEKQDIFLEAKRMDYIERMHNQKLEKQGGSVRLHRPLKESRWYS